jgi:hypothetical protein
MGALVKMPAAAALRLGLVAKGAECGDVAPMPADRAIDARRGSGRRIPLRSERQYPPGEPERA